MRPGEFFKYFLPVIIWMCLIFSGSTELGAPRNTSRIIGPILRWLDPAITEEAINKIQFVIRKCGHATEYAILSLLLWRAVRQRVPRSDHLWRWRDARLAIFVSALYASTDEFHQLFVSSREGRVSDVMLDTSGAIFGMFALWLAGRWRKRW